MLFRHRKAKFTNSVFSKIAFVPSIEKNQYLDFAIDPVITLSEVLSCELKTS